MPVPPVPLWRLEVDTAVGALLGTPSGQVQLPPDFVLRELMDLVPTTVRDVVELSGRWGLAAGLGAASFTHLPGEPPPDVLAETGRWPVGTALVHPIAVDLHLRALRTLSRHLLAHLDGADEAGLLAAWAAEGGAVPRTGSEAWTWWATHVNLGLSPLSVHVRLEGARAPYEPALNLYNACCLQLAQYVAGPTGVHRCANERCLRPFTRQRGRARTEHGRRSSGVRYCSHLCAKAQSERERRLRRTIGEKGTL